MKIGYFSPSYKRPEKSSTQIKYPFVKLVVRESESDEYLKNGNDIIVCPETAQGNLCRIRNWIIDNLMNDNDAIVIMDDDYKNISRWEKQKLIILNEDELQEEIEQLAILTKDYGFYFFGINIVTDKGAYMEHTPFSTNKYIGGPFQGFLKGSIPRYIEELNLKEDYDMTLQHLHMYGGCLRANYLNYDVKQANKKGRCAVTRTSKEEEKQFIMLQKKWGSNIIKRDNKSKRGFDFNPILKTPLKGV